MVVASTAGVVEPGEGQAGPDEEEEGIEVGEGFVGALIVLEGEEAFFKRGGAVGRLKEFAGEGEEAVGFGLAAHGAADGDMRHP